MPYRRHLLAVLACLVLLTGCARMPGTGVTALKARSYAELQAQVMARPPDVEQFRLRGPSEVSIHRNFELRLSANEVFLSDLYVSALPDRAPLVILLHGFDNAKETHAYQALHLATWGLHCLVLQLPNTGPWVANGRTLARIAAWVAQHPELVDRHVDASRIVLAGHSFGAFSVATALSEGAPALGGILLDPATPGREPRNLLGKIGKPVLVIGADTDFSETRGRDAFYRFIRGDVSEISVRGASHEDAEFPLEAAPLPFGGASPNEETQVTFVSALTAAAFSLAATSRFDYAWSGFQAAGESSRFFEPKTK